MPFSKGVYCPLVLNQYCKENMEHLFDLKKFESLFSTSNEVNTSFSLEGNERGFKNNFILDLESLPKPYKKALKYI
jgi:hypothetical protein